MSGYSDIIKQLSYTTPLNSLGVWTSEKIIAGQYSSLSISYASDQDIVLVIYFSNDGINFDIQISKTFSSGDGYENLVILGKWIKISITNIGLSTQTYLRVYTYGAVQNTSLSATISKIGNKSPEISVDNLPLGAFGELMVVEDRPQIQYVFNKGTTGLMQSRTWVLPYYDIYSYCDDDMVYLQFANGVMKFGYDMTINNYAIVKGSTYPYKPGQGIESKFTGYFIQSPKAAFGNKPVTELVGIGNYNSATNKPRDGYYFGYVLDSQEFGIVYYNDGSRTFYPRSGWNVDRADGTGNLPVIDFSKMQVYEITFQYLGFGAVRFYIENPSTGLPQLVHIINRVNSVISPSNLSNPSLGLLMFIEVESGSVPTALTNEIGMSSFTYTLQGEPIKPNERISLSGTKNTVSAEYPVLSIRCDTTFYSIQNYLPIDIDFMSVSCDGTKNTTIKLYRNCTLSGSVWSSPLPNSIPVSRDSTGTISLYGTELLAFTLDKAGKQMIDLDSIHMHLNPGDILTITAQSGANTDIIVAASCHIH